MIEAPNFIVISLIILYDRGVVCVFAYKLSILRRLPLLGVINSSRFKIPEGVHAITHTGAKMPKPSVRCDIMVDEIERGPFR